jgi:hypothetical protein
MVKLCGVQQERIFEADIWIFDGVFRKPQDICKGFLYICHLPQLAHKRDNLHDSP